MSSKFTEMNGLLTLLEMNPQFRLDLQQAISHASNNTIHLTEEDRLNIEKLSNIVKVTVSESEDGLMSKEDKKKLDTIESNANNYTHPSISGLNTELVYNNIRSE